MFWLYHLKVKTVSIPFNLTNLQATQATHSLNFNSVCKLEMALIFIKKKYILVLHKTSYDKLTISLKAGLSHHRTGLKCHFFDDAGLLKSWSWEAGNVFLNFTHSN